MRLTMRSRLSTSLATFVIVLDSCLAIPTSLQRCHPERSELNKLAQSKDPYTTKPTLTYQGVPAALSPKILKHHPSAPSAAQSASHTTHPEKFVSHTR